jgi:hypothetical protein
VANANESMASGVAQFSIFAKCQSKKHSQKRMWYMSKAEFEGGIG